MMRIGISDSITEEILTGITVFMTPVMSNNDNRGEMQNIRQAKKSRHKGLSFFDVGADCRGVLEAEDYWHEDGRVRRVSVPRRVRHESARPSRFRRVVLLVGSSRAHLLVGSSRLEMNPNRSHTVSGGLRGHLYAAPMTPPDAQRGPSSRPGCASGPSSRCSSSIRRCTSGRGRCRRSGNSAGVAGASATGRGPDREGEGHRRGGYKGGGGLPVARGGLSASRDATRSPGAGRASPVPPRNLLGARG